MKKVYLLIITIIILSSFSFNVESDNSQGIFLIEDAQGWIDAGFEDLGIYYENNKLLSFNMPVALKKEDVQNLGNKDIDHTIYNGNQNFTDRLRSITFEILESDTYYVVVYSMLVYASNKSFHIDFVPKIKGEELRQFAWWNSSWGFYKNITVANKIDDYQTKVTIGKSSSGDVNCKGHCNDSFADLRFVRNDTDEIPYWNENYTSGVQATFWVNNSYNSTYINMYYGNSAVDTTSNGNTTFDFYDNFYGVALNLTKWSGDTGGASVGSGIMTFFDAGWGGIYSSTFAGDRRIRGLSKMVCPEGKVGFFGHASVDFSHRGYQEMESLGATIYMTTKDGVLHEQTGTDWTYGIYALVQIDVDKGNYVAWYDNNVECLNSPNNTRVPNADMPVALWSAGSTISIDWVFVSKYNETEPSFTFGAEVTPPVSDSPSLVSEHYPSDTSNFSCPCCTCLGVTVSDNDSGFMNITFRSNYSGSWNVLGFIYNVTNGTHYMCFTNFSYFNYTYYWNVSVNDGNNTVDSVNFTLATDTFDNCNDSGVSEMEISIDETQFYFIVMLGLWLFFLYLGRERELTFMYWLQFVVAMPLILFTFGIAWLQNLPYGFLIGCAFVFATLVFLVKGYLKE